MHACLSTACTPSVRTFRVRQGLVAALEDEHDADLADVPAVWIADPAARFPANVAGALKELHHGLCRVRKSRRLQLPEVLQTLRTLQSAPSDEAPVAATQEQHFAAAACAHQLRHRVGQLLAGQLVQVAELEELVATVAGQVDEHAALGAAAQPPRRGRARGQAAAASDMSVLVRRMGRAAVAEDDEAQARRRVQRNASSAFDAAIRMLDARYKKQRAEAPGEFKERIDFYRRRCGMTAVLHERLHQLRIWRNASEHQDEGCWRREGPAGEGAFMALVREVNSRLEGP